MCSQDEIGWDSEISNNFKTKRIVLPDSRTNVCPTFGQLNDSYRALNNFVNTGVTFIHCYASIERSPLLCTLYIMKNYKLELEEALDYVRRKHRYANPTNYQLKTIKKFKNKFENKIDS